MSWLPPEACPTNVLSKDTVSNWRGEGAVVVEPGQELVERRTQLLRRVGDRGLGELSETTKTIGQFGSSTESMPMEAA